MHGSSRADAEPERFEPDVVAALPPELALSRLPVGRHGLPRSFIERNQRLRLVAAMLRILHRCGYSQTSISHVIREAGVSRSTFYGQFDGKEDCFLATYDLAAGWFCERVEGAAATGEEWPARVRAGVSEALRLLAANPELARLIAVEALQAGQVARRRWQACLTRLAEALRAGRPAGVEVPADMEELLIGGAFVHVARYVDAGHVEQLSDTTTELVHCLLVPYMDRDEIRRISDQAA